MPALPEPGVAARLMPSSMLAAGACAGIVKQRVVALLQEMNITPQRRVNTWTTEIVLDAPTLKKLLERHDAALFYQASVITMSKVTEQ